MARRARRILAAILCLGVLATMAAVAWLATSDSALQWLIARIRDASAERILVENAVRTGIASFRADRVRYADAGARVDASGVDVAFLPASLLRLRPVGEIAIDELRVVPGPSDGTPPAMPASLVAPRAFDLKSLRVRKLTVGHEDAPIVVDDLELGLAHDLTAYRLDLRRLNMPWASLSGNVAVEATPPFRVAGSLQARPASGHAGTIAIALSGDLPTVGVGVAAPVHGRLAVARLSVLPFSARTVARVEADVTGLDPTSFVPEAPRARIDARVEARIDRSGHASGRLQVLNTGAGTLVEGRVPLRAATAAFEGIGARWSFSDVAVDAGRAGRLSGNAAVTASAVEANLQARGLDLHALHAKLRPTSLAGPVRIASDGSRIAFDLKFAQGGDVLSAAGAYESGRIEVSHAQWRGAAGVVDLHGRVTTARPFAFEAGGRLAGFDPSRFGDYPAGRINARMVARGDAWPLAADIEASIVDSRFRGQPFAGRGRAGLQPDRIRDASVELSLGRAQASLSGSFGLPGDHLDWKIVVPDASVLHPQAGGSLQAQGTLIGSWRDPGMRIEFDAAKPALTPTARAERVRGKGALAQGSDGRFDLDAAIEGLRWNDAVIERARVVIEGTRGRHEARVDASAVDHRFAARLAGALESGPAWRGVLQSLRVEGRVETRLEQPVDLLVGSGELRTGAAALSVGRGRIDIAALTWSRTQGLSTRGSLAAVALGALHPVLPVPAALRSLVVAGRWDVVAGDTLAGSVALRRESGDIVIPGTPELPARLGMLSVEMQVRGTALDVRARIESGSFGTVSAAGSVQAERRDGRWGIAASAPLSGSVEGTMPSLAWARALLPAGVTLDGRSDVAVRVRGTLSDPLFEGSLQGRDLLVRVPDAGVTLREGTLDAVFDRRQITLRTVRFASGEGELTGTGDAVLSPESPVARVGLTARRLTVLGRPDRLAVVSGRIDLAWDKRRLRAEGRLAADRGVIELPREDKPRPSSDVVVLGAKPSVRQDADVLADVSFDLGQDFLLRGRGLSTHLAGTLRAQLAPGSGLALTGSVRAVDGSYMAFGQKLDIQRGTLTFVGPPDNPALDVLAVRKVSTVEVGVAVGGTALLPQIRLVSTPAMSDADKLAWLTLGHGLDQAGRNDAAVLQAAAMALLSRGSGEGKGTFASRFGLDELSLGTVSGTGERVVSVGKRFASNFYLGFERGVTGAVSVVKITYDLSRRWSVQARAGSENALDLFYTLGFR